MTRADAIFKELRERASRFHGKLAKVRLRRCKAADEEHRRSFRQFAHFGHFPMTVCHAGALDELLPEYQAGILAHELGHATASLAGFDEHTEEEANRLGGIVTGLKINFSGPHRLERVREIPRWLKEVS